MSGSRRLTVEIAGDAKGLGKAFGESSKAADGFGSKLAGVGKASGIAFVAMGAGAIAMVPDILKTGAELDALGKKAGTVFEDSLDGVQSWAKANASAMGLTAKEATGLAAGFGDLMKPMGFTSKQAADMSTKVLDLSGALSAWSGGQASAAEVSDIITKAMLGETDGLKALGISISAADIQARLAAKGQDQLTGSALEQAKALTTQELIFEKSTDAQKAWTDGSMDGIKAQNESKAAMASLKETLITALYPALQTLVPLVADAAQWLGEKLPGAIAVVKGWVETNLIPVFRSIGEVMGEVVGFISDHWAQISAVVSEAFGYIREVISGTMDAIKGIIDVVMGVLSGDWGRAWDGIKGIVSGVWTAIKGEIQLVLLEIKVAIGLVWDAIKGAASSAWDGIKTAITTPINAAKEAIGAVWTGIKDPASSAWESIRQAAVTAWVLVRTAVTAPIEAAKEIISGTWDSIVRQVTGLPGRIASAAAGMWDGIKNSFKAVINAVIGWWNGLRFPSFNIPQLTIPTPPGMDDWHIGGGTFGGWDLPNIPTLHTGGIVPGVGGADVLTMLQAGEGVFTQDQMRALGSGGGGVHIENLTIVMPPGSDGEDVVAAIQKYERRNGSGWRSV